MQTEATWSNIVDRKKAPHMHQEKDDIAGFPSETPTTQFPKCRRFVVTPLKKVLEKLHYFWKHCYSKKHFWMLSKISL